MQEDRSRRNNSRVEGVVDFVRESWDKTERKLQQLFDEHLGLNDIFIERAGRVKRGDKSKESQRTIVAKLLHYKDEELLIPISNKLNDTAYCIKQATQKK